jgi:hypothetical protein
MLRSYSTIGRAMSYARKLQTKFPDRTFTVVLSPFSSYAFRYLIRTGSAYVGR